MAVQKNGPPIVPGLSVDPTRKPDPLAFLAQMIGSAASGGPDPREQGMALVQQAMGLLGKAAKVDPRLTPMVETVQRIIIRGPSQADGSPVGAGGESGEISGPIKPLPIGMPPKGPM